MWESIIQTDCPEEIIPEWHNIIRKMVTERVERVVSINLYQLPFDIFMFIFHVILFIQRNSSSKIDLFLMLETHGETHTLLTEIFMEAALHGLQHMMSEVKRSHYN